MFNMIKDFLTANKSKEIANDFKYTNYYSDEISRTICEIEKDIVLARNNGFYKVQYICKSFYRNVDMDKIEEHFKNLGYKIKTKHRSTLTTCSRTYNSYDILITWEDDTQ